MCRICGFATPSIASHMEHRLLPGAVSSSRGGIESRGHRSIFERTRVRLLDPTANVILTSLKAWSTARDRKRELAPLSLCRDEQTVRQPSFTMRLASGAHEIQCARKVSGERLVKR